MNTWFLYNKTKYVKPSVQYSIQILLILLNIVNKKEKYSALYAKVDG